MMKEVKILLFGVSLQSANKGCEALAYSLFSMLNTILRRRDMRAKVSSVVYLPKGQTLERDMSAFDRIDHVFLPNRKRSLQAQWNIVKAIREADLCIDMTEGDSFSDIYGSSRFYWRTAEKALVLLCGKRLILGPQTYGPYGTAVSRGFASWVLWRADCVVTRDEPSAALVREMTGKSPCVATDIAFDLPTNAALLPERQGRRIGINVSGLLWNGGYTGNDQFGLKVDYMDYITQLIRHCLDKGTEVWLIPHVIMAPDDPDPENDLAVCLALCREFPQCRVIEASDTPMELKGLISQMDVFVGARMHAVIAAFSCGVPAIPFAYSKKFGDLFGSLGYPWLIDGRILTTDEALEQTCRLIADPAPLMESIKHSRGIIRERIDRFTKILDTYLSDGVLL